MISLPPPALLPEERQTACGSTISITPDTPFVHFHDEVVFFCGQDCKQRFESHPMSSCMAARLHNGK